MNLVKTLVSSHGYMKIAPNGQSLKMDFKKLGRPPVLPTHCLGHCFLGRDFPKQHPIYGFPEIQIGSFVTKRPFLL